MRIYIDADGCPVVDSTLRLAAAHRVETVILCDTSHEIQRPGVQTVTVPRGRTAWISPWSTGWPRGMW